MKKSTLLNPFIVFVLLSFISLSAFSETCLSQSKRQGNNFQLMSLDSEPTIKDEQCPSELKDYVFTSQQQIDNFGKNYPNCHHAPQLRINGEDINNLDGLSNLTSVSSTDEIKCKGGNETAIVIGDLSSVDPSTAKANPNLINLSGLNNVSHVGGDIFIQNNKSLKDIHAFKALQTMLIHIKFNDLTVTTNFNIFDNPELQQVDALGNLSVSNAVHFSENPKLSVINGDFTQLKHLTGGLYIERNNLSTLSAFKYLIGTHDIVVNYSPVVNLGLNSFVGTWYENPYLFGVNSIDLGGDLKLTQCKSLAYIYHKNPQVFGIGSHTNPKCLDSLKIWLG